MRTSDSKDFPNKIKSDDIQSQLTLGPGWDKAIDACDFNIEVNEKELSNLMLSTWNSMSPLSSWPQTMAKVLASCPERWLSFKKDEPKGKV